MARTAADAGGLGTEVPQRRPGVKSLVGVRESKLPKTEVWGRSPPKFDIF